MSESTHIENAGSCIATAQAISAPGRIRWMMRTPSAVSSDSGWRFYADEDDEENVAHTTNMRVVDFNQVVDLEPIVASVYDQPVGSDFELVTGEDGQRRIIDTTTGRPVGEPAGEPAEGAVAPEVTAPAAEPAAAVSQAPEAGQASSGTDSAAQGGWNAPAAPATPVNDPAADDAAVTASAAWLRPAVQAVMADPSPAQRGSMLSEFFGATVLVPARGGAPLGFAHQGGLVIPAHTSRAGLVAWQARLGQPAGEALAINGDELLRNAFEAQGASAVVLDPIEAGMEIRAEDPQLGSLARNGKLKALVRSGDRQAVLNYLVSDGAYGVYLYRAQPGQQAFPLLVTRQGGGEREFALFSSALEVFRYQGDGSAAQVGLDWVRANLAEDMYLCVDPGAAGGFMEFSPAELAAAGFRTA
ncbi:immunity protein Imm33 domain-containing protein [Galactobacter valiniphilus]|uniref:immunity protein Imm33 domain-containing protein n=1 Tax=Galactobacter valiniphilus TaxID=2676122 RepID=UPI003736C2A4